MLVPFGHVVIDSGANHGTGRAVAETLHANGYSVSAGARDPAALATALARLGRALHHGRLPAAQGPAVLAVGARTRCRSVCRAARSPA